MSAAGSVNRRRYSRFWKLAAAFPLLQFGGCVSQILDVLDGVIATAFLDGFNAVSDNLLTVLGG